MSLRLQNPLPMVTSKAPGSLLLTLAWLLCHMEVARDLPITGTQLCRLGQSDASQLKASVWGCAAFSRHAPPQWHRPSPLLPSAFSWLLRLSSPCPPGHSFEWDGSQVTIRWLWHLPAVRIPWERRRSWDVCGWNSATICGKHANYACWGKVGAIELWRVMHLFCCRVDVLFRNKPLQIIH